MKFESQFAILDVTRGRAALARWFRQKPRAPVSCPDRLKIPVVVVGYMTGVWGSDDGESQEFVVEVTRVEVGKPGVRLEEPRGRGEAG